MTLLRDRRHLIRIAWWHLAALFSVAVTATAGAYEHVEGFEGGSIDPLWWEIDRHGRCEIDPVRAPVRAGSFSLRFRAGTGARCEIVHWPRNRLFQWFRREPYHQDRWYGFSVFLEEDRERGIPTENEVIAQWHGSGDVWLLEPGGRGPPLALRIQGGYWRITHGWDADLRSSPGVKTRNVLWTGPISKGRWTDWVFHVIWSHEDDGLLEVWKDGIEIAAYAGPTAFNDLRGVYLKLGSYHPRADQTVYLDEVRVGNEQSIVAPLLDLDTRRHLEDQRDVE